VISWHPAGQCEWNNDNTPSESFDIMAWIIKHETKTSLLSQLFRWIAGLSSGLERNAIHLSPVFRFGKGKVAEAIPPIVH